MKLMIPKHHICSGLNGNGPQKHIFECLALSWWILEGLGEVTLVEEVCPCRKKYVSGVHSDTSKVHTHQV